MSSPKLTRADGEAAVRAAFPRGDMAMLMDLIDRYETESCEREIERVQMAIVALGRGSEEKLAELVQVAKTDYRDVLSWADSGPLSESEGREQRERASSCFGSGGLRSLRDSGARTKGLVPMSFRIVGIGIAALLGGCAAPTALKATDRPALGRIEVKSATFGNVELTPARCVSGEHQVFLGADFIDAARGAALRLILLPTGEATLRVFKISTPLDPGIVVPRAACNKFQLSFERTGWQINDVYDVGVSLDVDCRTAAGDSVQGMVSARHCN